MASRKRFLPNLAARKSSSTAAETPAPSIATSTPPVTSCRESENTEGANANRTPAGESRNVVDTRGEAGIVTPSLSLTSPPRPSPVATRAQPSSASEATTSTDERRDSQHPEAAAGTADATAATATTASTAQIAGTSIVSATRSSRRNSSSAVTHAASSTRALPSSQSNPSSPPPSASETSTVSNSLSSSPVLDDSVFVAANVDVPAKKTRSRKRAASSQSSGPTSAASTPRKTAAKGKRAPRGKKAASEEHADDDGTDTGKTAAKKKSKESRGTLTEAPEPTKIRMRDLVRLNPTANPMSTSSASSTPTKSQTASLGSVSSADISSMPGSPMTSSTTTAPESTSGTGSLAPQVRVAEDGTIVIDESSLILQTSASERALAEVKEVVYEQANSATYTSYRKKNKMERWTKEETDKFFDILQQVGTDFSLMEPAFPNKNRGQLKNKFKKEEKGSPGRVTHCLRQRKPIDMDLFKRPSPPEEPKEAEESVAAAAVAPAAVAPAAMAPAAMAPAADPPPAPKESEGTLPKDTEGTDSTEPTGTDQAVIKSSELATMGLEATGGAVFMGL